MKVTTLWKEFDDDTRQLSACWQKVSSHRRCILVNKVHLEFSFCIDVFGNVCWALRANQASVESSALAGPVFMFSPQHASCNVLNTHWCVGRQQAEADMLTSCTASNITQVWHWTRLAAGSMHPFLYPALPKVCFSMALHSVLDVKSPFIVTT